MKRTPQAFVRRQRNKEQGSRSEATGEEMKGGQGQGQGQGKCCRWNRHTTWLIANKGQGKSLHPVAANQKFIVII